MRTTNFAIAAMAVIAAVATMPAMAANGSKDQTKPAATKHTMAVRHHAALQTRGRAALMPRGSAEARANFTNANASTSAGTQVKDETMAAQLGKTATISGRASDPICHPGTMTPLGDGKMHPCQ